MRARDLVRAGLIGHRGSHVGLAAGILVAAASLVGALLLGASVEGSLRAAAHARIGQVTHALIGGERSFTDGLADELEAGLGADALCAPIWLLSGTVSTPDGKRGADGVQIVGVDERFFRLGPRAGEAQAPVLADGEALVNEALAERLAGAEGLELVCRLPAPSGIPRDMVVATREDAGAVVRTRVLAEVGDEGFGRFALVAGGGATPTLFVSRNWLAEELEVSGRANVLLLGAGTETSELERVLRKVWKPADAGLSMREVREGSWVELTSSRVFLDPPIVEGLAHLEPSPLGVLTYFVNGLGANERTTPYSMVTGLGPLAGDTPEARSALDPGYAELLPEADELIATDWLSEDLQLAPGDTIELSYFAFGETRRLLEASAELRVSKSLSIEGARADPSLAPDLPGLSGEDDCQDWDPGIPVDLDRIRDVDEVYWDEHRGTPKAFVALSTARRLWGNRFGDLTAVRVPMEQKSALEEALRNAVDPGDLGLYFVNLAARAEAGQDAPTDFGGLFLGLSFFLVAGALILTGLFFALATERRAAEIGVLRAVGLRPRQVLGIFLAEAACVGLVSSFAGALCGMLYTRVLLHGLETLWSGAVASAAIDFHAPAGTVIAGAIGAWLSAMASVTLAVRRAFRLSPVTLLRAESGFVAQERIPGGTSRRDAWLATGLAGVVVVLYLITDPASPSAPGVFFALGAVVLLAVLLAVRARLARTPVERGALSPAKLGRRNASRRLGRSVATVALLAGGVFLMISIAVHQKAPPADPLERKSGTGGFLLVATTSLPLLYDLDDEEGRDAFALSEDELASASFVPLRVRAGDEASCLNLNAPQAPRLLGVRSDRLQSRGAFSFASAWEERSADWTLLDEELEGDQVPGVVDASSLRWTLKKSVGDVIAYRDEMGRGFDVRVVGTLEDSVLQGGVVISESAFVRRFPSESGHRMFLVDGPLESSDELSEVLGRGLADLGVVLETSAARLGRFQAVQNTYLAIFQALGGLGLLLGAVGFAVLLLRHTFERRAELATVRALGFGRAELARYVAAEFRFLLGAAVAGGALAALAATLPVVPLDGGEGARLVYLGGLWSGGLFVFGWVALWVATRRALAGGMIDALRSE